MVLYCGLVNAQISYGSLDGAVRPPGVAGQALAKRFQAPHLTQHCNLPISALLCKLNFSMNFCRSSAGTGGFNLAFLGKASGSDHGIKRWADTPHVL